MQKPNKFQDDLGYGANQREPDTNIKTIQEKSKIISPLESPIKEWWKRKQEENK